MKRKILTGFLALVLVLQAFIPSFAYALEEKPKDNKLITKKLESSDSNFITIGKLKGVGFSKDNPTASISIEGVEEKNHKDTATLDGLEIGDEIIPQALRSPKSPYIEGQQPADSEKPKYWANVQGTLTTVGLDGGSFDWNKVLGQGAKVKLLFTQTNGNVMTGVRFYLEVDKDGTYTWSNSDDNPTYLPLYDVDGNPYTYNVQIQRNFSENVQLIIQESNGTPGVSWRPEGDKQVATISFLDINIQQVASTKFVSEWHTSLAEADRPQIEGYFEVDTDVDNDFNFPKNDTTRTILRSSFVENFDEDEVNGPWSFLPSELETTPKTVEVKTDTQGLTFEENNGVKTVTSGDHKFKYDFNYDVIEGGKLSMTEIISVTFDANGGKFASITEEGADQKIVKEVDYEGTLTDKAEDPTREGKTFKGWSITKGGAIATDADFANIKEAKTFYAIWENNDIKAEELTVFESFKDGTGYVNDFIPTLDTLKGQVEIKNANGVYQKLKDGDSLQILDDSGNPIADDLKDRLYDKLKEDDATEVSRNLTLRGKVNFADGTSQEVDIPIKVIKNIYEAKTEEGKPNYVPDGYVKVTVDPTTKAKDPQKYFYYVNPGAKVVIPGKDPVGVDGNTFTKWTMKADGATGDGADYTLADRHQFTEASTITAQYSKDVIPQEGDTKPEGVPDNFVKVTFVPTDKGTMEGAKIFWVNSAVEVTIPVNNPVGKTHYTFKEWKMGANADGAVYTPSTPTKFTDTNGTTITATYKESDNIIPYDPSVPDPMPRPEGYVRVTFAADPGLKLTESKAYYVKANAGITLKTIKDDATKGYPTYEEQTGYKFKEWDKKDDLEIVTTDITVTAKATKLDNVIPEKDGEGNPNTKPEGYVTVRFLTNKNGNLIGETTFYVNPKAGKKMTDITAPTITANDGYKVGSPKWKPDLAADTEAITEDKIFVANYDSLGKAEITYISMDINMGTVSPASEELKDGVDVVGSTATAKDGYKFVKWTDVTGNQVSTNSKFLPSKKESATYIAVFEKEESTADRVKKLFDLEGVDLAAFVGDALTNDFWKDGVKSTEKATSPFTEDEKTAIREALKNATVSDASERNTAHEVLSPSKGTLEIKFADGSVLTVLQKLYVYNNGSDKPGDPNHPTPKDKVEVTYKAGEGVENFADKTVLVKKGTKEAELPGKPVAQAKEGYKDLKWTADPAIDETNGVQANTTVTASAVTDHDFAKTSFTVTKVWANDVNPVPTMNFTLYRKVKGSQDEPVKVDDAEVKTITKDVTTATWDNLAKTDSEGKEYEYSVKESFAEKDVKNDNWILGKMVTAEGKNTITNKLKAVPGTGDTPDENEHRMGKLTITKKIESTVIQPQMSRAMHRAPAAPLAFTFKVTDPYGNVETFTLKAGESKKLNNLLYGDYTVEETDAKGLTPFVKVGDGAETESKTGKVTLTTTAKEGSVTFTNKNVKPVENPNIIEVKATKVWANGPSTDHTAVDLKLSRQVDGGQVEEVTDVTPVKSRDANDVNKFNYVWKDLPKINDKGEEYTYTVEEANVTDNKVTVNGNTYTVSQEGNTITNTYVVQQTEYLIATKQWVGVPDGTATPAVKFQLQRTVNGVTEDVGQVMDLNNNQANFGKQDKTDANGVEYIYSVKEVDENGNAFNHPNYTSEVNGLTVTNTYHAPEVKYTVTYLSGSSTATGTMNPVIVAENTDHTVLANGFTNDGYTFKGWKVGNTTQIIQPGTIIPITGDVTLTAQWEKTTTPPTPDPDKPNPDKPNPWDPNPWNPDYPKPWNPNYPDLPYIPRYPEIRYETIVQEKIVKVPVPIADNAYVKEVRYMQGFMGEFRPKDGLTRAEAAQILANALVEDGYKYNANFKLPYKDIGEAWYTRAVKIVTEANVFEGYDDGNFKPQDKITRNEWIATLKRFQELGDVSGNHMKLKDGHWAMAEIEAAYKEGWLKIYSDGLATYEGDKFIPREEVAAVSNKAFNRVLDKTYIINNDKNLITYKDVKKDMWSYEDILCASNTFLYKKDLYRAHWIKEDNNQFNINIDGFEIVKAKFQRNPR